MEATTDSLPFKVGQRMETRSFQTGYRGAWFRCEIKEIGQKGYGLQYYDYPDEKLRWMRALYQKSKWKKQHGDKKILMIRPHYPEVYFEDEVPDIRKLSEIIVARDRRAWKVGDLVDWFCDGAYWSGKVTKLKGEDKIEVQLHPLPIGEGGYYEAFTTDLRPSLDWSLESGWTLPASENGHACARLVQPVGINFVDVKTKDDAEVIELEADFSTSSSSSSSSAMPTLKRLQSKEEECQSKESCQATDKERPEAPEDNAHDKAGCSSGAAMSNLSSPANVQDSTGVDCDDSLENVGGAASANGFSKRIRRSEDIPSPPKSPSDDSIESMLIDLEELLCDIKCVQKMIESPEESTAGTEWEFFDTTTPSK